jgi:nucleotide-binding universal stress UspA family protein
MFKTIVVGTDGRAGGRDALALAARLALLAGGELIAVRALPFDYYASRAGSPPYASIADQEAKRELEEELEGASVTASVRIQGDTSPARALHRVAEAEHADVVVVGSTHHGAVGRVFAGDDAAATLHGSSCPVAVAPHGLAAADWKPVQVIGVGFDGGPESEQALALAVALAQNCGASIAVQSVVATPVPFADFAVYDDEWLDTTKERAAERLQAALADIPLETSGDVVVGDPVDELTELSHNVDLLVLGSRAWGPVRRTVIGSTAAKLMRTAHCPVLVLPRGAATGQPGERDPDGVGHEAVATA